MRVPQFAFGYSAGLLEKLPRPRGRQEDQFLPGSLSINSLSFHLVRKIGREKEGGFLCISQAKRISANSAKSLFLPAEVPCHSSEQHSYKRKAVRVACKVLRMGCVIKMRAGLPKYRGLTSWLRTLKFECCSGLFPPVAEKGYSNALNISVAGSHVQRGEAFYSHALERKACKVHMDIPHRIRPATKPIKATSAQKNLTRCSRIWPRAGLKKWVL